MSSEVAFVSKTQHYLKVKKPLLERQRRARINKCLDAIKILVAEFQNDDAILRMDKAEMLEATILFMRDQSMGGAQKVHSTASAAAPPTSPTLDGFRNGYMNAVGEVSRVMAAMPGMSVDIGKSVMTQLGLEFNRMWGAKSATSPSTMQPLTVLPATSSTKKAPLSPASSGYHSDCDDGSMTSSSTQHTEQSIWRPW